MKERRLNLRFNLNRDEDRKALEHIKLCAEHRHCSLNKAVILIVAAAVRYENILSNEDHFLEQIREMLREELKAAPLSSPVHTADIQTESQAEAEEIMDDFLSSF